MTPSSAVAWMSRRGTWILPAGVVLGLAWQDFAAVMRPALPFSVFAMLTLLLTRLDLAETFTHLRKPRLLLAGLAWALLVMPVLMFAVLTVWPVSPGLKLALIIYATSPPNFSTAALAWMFGLDGNLALVFTLTAIGLHPIVTPAFTGLMTDGAAGLTAAELALRLAGLIGAAGLASLVLRWLIPSEAIRRGSTTFDAAHILIMLVFAVALMDGITARIVAEPVFALQLIALSFALHIAINVLSFFVLRVLAGVKSAATLAYCNGGRNIAIAMSVLGSSAPDDAWLFFAMLQFPIYILPMLMQPVYRRLLPQPS